MRPPLPRTIIQLKPVKVQRPLPRGAHNKLRNLALGTRKPILSLPPHAAAAQLDALDMLQHIWMRVPRVRGLIHGRLEARHVELEGRGAGEGARRVLDAVRVEVELETADYGFVVWHVEGDFDVFGCAGGGLGVC